MPNVQERAGEGYNSGIKAGHVASSACSSLEDSVFPSCPGWQAFGGGGGGGARVPKLALVPCLDPNTVS